MAKEPGKSGGQPEKSEAEIMRDMNETLKRMHKMPPKPHSATKVAKAPPPKNTSRGK